MKVPTYTAKELEKFAMTITDPDQMKVLATLINEEIELYTEEEMVIVGRAALMIFVRSLIMGSMKLLSL